MLLSEVEKQAFARSSGVDVAERRIVRQLIEALLFEQITPFTIKDRDSSESVDWKEHYDVLCNAEDVFDQQFSFRLGRQLFRTLGTVGAFNRVRIAPGTIQHYSILENAWYEATLSQVIDALDVGDATKGRLRQELGQTLDLCRWNMDNLRHHVCVRRQLDFQTLESAIVEGHLYHPCFKTRTGFSENDHRLYGPEAANQFQLMWLAVKREKIDSNLPGQEADFWRQEIGATVYKKLSEKVVSLDSSWRGYGLIPIHPWQYQTILPLGLAQAISEKEIMVLGCAGDFYQASQSLRTLVNISNPHKANIKVPLNVVCTSSHRNLQSHFVHTAPVISTWLQNLVINDAYLQKQNNALFLSEYAGLLYEPTGDDKLQGRIGVIFRESVMAKLESGQAALPFSALMLMESDGRPFIADWLERHGIEVWVNQLLATMLVPIWHMLVHQGVAFEAHSQNLLLIHRDGWPEKIVLRDFHEDTEYVVDFLKDPQNVPELAAVDPYFLSVELNEGFAMADIGALRELFMDTVYIFNLADLAFLLERFYGFSDQAFWQLVQNQLAEYALAGVTDEDRLRKVAADQSEIIVESLLKKKIMGGGLLDYYEHTVSNRLHPQKKVHV